MPGEWWPFSSSVSDTSTNGQTTPQLTMTRREGLNPPAGQPMAAPPVKPPQLRSSAASTPLVTFSAPPTASNPIEEASLSRRRPLSIFRNSSVQPPTADSSVAKGPLQKERQELLQTRPGVNIHPDKHPVLRRFSRLLGRQNSDHSMNQSPDHCRQSFESPLITNPRLLHSLDMMKIGMKMGFVIGGIFGAVSGTYSAAVNRNILVIPTSVAVGALSFGFFLSCGMLVRCDDRSHGPDESPPPVFAASCLPPQCRWQTSFCSTANGVTSSCSGR